MSGAVHSSLNETNASHTSEEVKVARHKESVLGDIKHLISEYKKERKIHAV